MEYASLYLSEPKADFTPNYESVAAKLSLGRSIDEAHEPNLSILPSGPDGPGLSSHLGHGNLGK